MNYSISKLTLSILAFLFLSFYSNAQTELTSIEIENFQQQVFAKAEEVQNLQGTFIQTKHEEFLSSPAESSGKFYYNTNNQLNWTYKEPFAMGILFTDGKLFLTENGKAREIDVSAYKMFDQLSELISESINGKIIQQQDFEITYTKASDFTKTILKPISQQQQLFSQIELYFNSNYLVEQIKLIEGEESYVLIRLNDLKVNQPIAESVFEVEK